MRFQNNEEETQTRNFLVFIMQLGARKVLNSVERSCVGRKPQFTGLQWALALKEDGS
jgi:hypothetical protein